MTKFEYDLASMTEPRLILITDEVGKRSSVTRLGTVVLPSRCYPAIAYAAKYQRERTS